MRRYGRDDRCQQGAEWPAFEQMIASASRSGARSSAGLVSPVADLTDG